MIKGINQLIGSFSTQPILFIGSGISRRYLGIDNWEELLAHHAKLITDDEFAYRMYEHRAKKEGYTNGLLPKIGELIENDFNDKWLSDSNFRNKHNMYSDKVRDGGSPFKSEIAHYMNQKFLSGCIPELSQEIDMMRKISHKSVSAIITTNYDNLLEDLFEGYDVYVGQEELIFSDIKGVGEIYKIHGSCTAPDSIVLTDTDYTIFNEKNAYLAAKILTLFLEHPIIFLGYSMSDSNIESILKEIIKCLSKDKIDKLKDRLIFVEWNEDARQEISSYTHAFEDGKSVALTKLVLNDFSNLFQALLNHTGKYDSKVLRQLKEDIYELVLTSNPVGKMKVVGLEDSKLDNVEVVVGVGVLANLGLKGYKSIESKELYSDIILDNGNYDFEQIATIALPDMLKKNSSSLPIFKYISVVDSTHLSYSVNNLAERINRDGFDSFTNATIRNTRVGIHINTRTISGICIQTNDIDKQLYFITHLTAEQMPLFHLENYLQELFKYPNLWNNLKQSSVTNLKRLIRIYDWMKYSKM